MRPILLLLAAAMAGQCQYPSLAVTDDGRQLYFASKARLAGEPPGTSYRILRFGDSGWSVFAEPSGTVPRYVDPSIQPGVYFPYVSGDGRIVGYTSDEYCPLFHACHPGAFTTGVVRGNLERNLGEGTMSLSHNGRWAILTERDYGSIYPGPNSFMIDLETGKTIPIQDPVYPPIQIADDGAIARLNWYGASVWRPGETIPLPLPPHLLGGPAGISADGRIVVSVDSAYGGDAGRLFVVDVATKRQTTLLSWPEQDVYMRVYGISNDGRLVLYSRSDEPLIARVADTVTAEQVLIGLPAGGPIRSGALSGYGNAVFLLSADGWIWMATLGPDSQIQPQLLRIR